MHENLEHPIPDLDPGGVVRAEASSARSRAPRLAFRPDTVIGRSEAMGELYGKLAAVADAPVPVLLTGETGVGKEHLARLVHDSSSRRRGPFVPINCAALPAELLEAELFGIEEGVATGVRRRKGAFREARRGTIFLDEIGEMAPTLQAKLLRVLQERQVRPVGGQPVGIDVRVVSATNSDLERRRADGAFRDDLYYRLAGIVLRVPPLRERPEDIPALVEHFVGKFAKEAGRPVPRIPEPLLGTLMAHPWPGNVRQLEHEVRRLVYLGSEETTLQTTYLSEELTRAPVHEPEQAAAQADDTSLDLATHVERLERRLIHRALERTDGNLSRAARLLGLSRNGLKAKCRRYGIRR